MFLYQLAKVNGLTSEFLVDHLKKVAFSGPVIVGTTEKGYFIFDTDQPDAKAQLFDSAEEWHAALTTIGITANIQLNDPDVMAAALADQQLHPYHYRVMKGRLGLSDDGWGAIVMLTSLAIMFLRGLLMRPNAALFRLALLSAASVTVVEIVLGVLDSGGFLGFIMYPGLFWLVGKFGWFVRKIVSAVIRRRAQGSASPA